MATIVNTEDNIFEVSLNSDENSVTLATEHTYVDKNIIIKLNITSISAEEIDDLTKDIIKEL